MRRAVAAAMLFVACGGFAQSAGDSPESVLANQLEEASTIEDPAARLQAYDRIVQDYQLASQATVQLQSSKWVFSTRADPEDGSQTALFTLASDPGAAVENGPVSLVLLHTPSRTEVFINWKVDVGPVGYVTWGIDSDDAQTTEWSVSQNRQATFYPGNPVAFIQGLERSARLSAQIAPAGHDPVQANFDLRGLRDAINRYARDIGW